jgi:hypothetical protein
LAFHSGREADHSPPSSAEVKEWVELYLHSPNTPSWRGAQLGGAQGELYFFYGSSGDLIYDIQIPLCTVKFAATLNCHYRTGLSISSTTAERRRMNFHLRYELWSFLSYTNYAIILL